MAIQNRRGNYEDFVPSKMLPGEFAVVQNGDPNSTDGKAVYMAFQTGDVKRLATYNELQTEVSNAAEEIAQDITDDFEQQITPLVNSASQSASNASASATQAQNIVNSAVADIQAAGTTQVTAVQAKGDEVLDSIPADYTDLSDDVTALKADLSKYRTLKYTSTNGYINAYGSYVDPTSNAEKYTNRISVEKGDLFTFEIKFSSSTSIWVAYATYNNSGAFVERIVLHSAQGLSYLGSVVIGDNIGAVEFTYQTHGESEPIICMYRNITRVFDAVNIDHNAINVSGLVDPLNNYKCEIGGIYNGDNTEGTNRCRTADFIRAKQGDVLHIINPAVYYALTIYNSEGSYLSSTGWITNDSTISNADAAFIRVTMRKRDNSTITAAEMAELASGIQLVRSDIWTILSDSYLESARISSLAQIIGESYACELGTIYLGQDYDSTTRCRTDGYIETFGCKVFVNDNYQCAISVFDNEKQLIRDTGWKKTDCVITDENMRYIRITMRKNDNSEISANEVQTIAKTFGLIRELNESCFSKPYAIPEYFEAEAQDCATKLKAYCTEKAFVIGIVTDTHVYQAPVSRKWWHDTVANIERVNALYQFDSVVHLGDIINGSLTSETSASLIEEVRDDINKVLKPTFMLVGNHDPNLFYDNGSDPITESMMYALMERYNEIDTTSRPSGKPYWYKDYDSIGIRVIYLSAHMGDGYDKSEQSWGYPQEEITWYTNDALNTNKQVLILSHMPFTPGYVSGISTVPLNGESMKAATNSFINNGGSVIGLINGHTHFDYVHDNGAFNEISLGAEVNTENTETKTGTNIYFYAPTTAKQYGRTAGTLTQDLWSILVVRPASKTCKIIRFGAGDDVSWSY